MVKKFCIAILLAVALPGYAFSLSFGNSYASTSRFDSANRASNPAMIKPSTVTSSLGSNPNSTLKKRRGRAFARSLLIPGWGQITEGRGSIGYTFLTTEAVLICSFIGLRVYGSWLEDDYKTYADQHAGITGSHGHQFYVDIGNWMNNRLFNEQRIINRQFDQMYITPGDEWSWDSDENRIWFKSRRISSDRARQNSIMVVGALVLNHLVSAIEASRGIQSPEVSLRLESINSVGLQIRF